MKAYSFSTLKRSPWEIFLLDDLSGPFFIFNKVYSEIQIDLNNPVYKYMVFDEKSDLLLFDSNFIIFTLEEKKWDYT